MQLGLQHECGYVQYTEVEDETLCSIIISEMIEAHRQIHIAHDNGDREFITENPDWEPSNCVLQNRTLQ